MKPIRCMECYQRRPGGRCEFCPMHKKNRSKYKEIGNGWYVYNDKHAPAPPSKRNHKSKQD